MEIVEWDIGGYKSIVEEQGISLADLNVVVGRNNSGKSNILNSLLDYQFIFDNDPHVNWKRKKSSGKEFQRKIRFHAQFRLSDSEMRDLYGRLEKTDYVEQSELEEWFENDYLRYIEHHKNYGPAGNPGSDVLTANFGNRNIPLRFEAENRNLRSTDINSLTDLNNLSFSDPRMGRAIWSHISEIIEKSVNSWKSVDAFRDPDNQLDVFNTIELDSDGRNLTQVLHTLRDQPGDKFETIADTYAEVMEGVEGIRTPLRERQKTTIAIDEIGFPGGFDLEEISSGSKEVLTLITQIVLAREDTDLLLIEEPELHLHPSAERRIFDLIESTVNRDDGPQVIISTHSKVFVDLSKANSIIRVDRAQNTGKTSIKTIEEQVIDEVLIDLGYQKSDLFQASVVVFVEGRSDQRILEECSRTLADTFDRIESFEELGITVHPVGGDRLRKHGKELAHIVGRLRIPYLFVVDSDDQEPEDKAEEMEAELETSNIYVLDEYCIESYLLGAPRAIADAFRYEHQEVADFIEENANRPNKKEVIKELYSEFEDGQVSYDEEQHGSMIARHMDSSQIDSELRQLIERIQDLADN